MNASDLAVITTGFRKNRNPTDDCKQKRIDE